VTPRTRDDCPASAGALTNVGLKKCDSLMWHTRPVCFVRKHDRLNRNLDLAPASTRRSLEKPLRRLTLQERLDESIQQVGLRDHCGV